MPAPKKKAAVAKKPAASPKKKVRVAMIGAGSMANNVHYPSLHSFSDVEIVGVCDFDPDRLRTTADKWGIANRYQADGLYTYRKMIEEQAPDAVYAVGQPDAMIPIWLWCLKQKLNLFIEKPMGLTLHQAQMMAALAEENGCITQVGLQRRSSPMVMKLREECLKRGPIDHAICRFYKNAIATQAEPRDHMMDDGVHAIDTIRWMCGGELVALESHCKRLGVADINWITATMHFDTGATGILINSWASGRRIFDVEMHAPGICVEAEHETKGYMYINNDTQGIEFDAKDVAGGSELWQFGGFMTKNREFIDAVKNGTLPSSHFGDAVKTVEIAEIILAQAVLAGE